MKKFWSKKKKSNAYYYLGAAVLVLVVAGAYAFSSGNLFQGALTGLYPTSPTVKTYKPVTTSTSTSGTQSIIKTTSTTTTNNTAYQVSPQQLAPPTIGSVSVDKTNYVAETGSLKITYNLQGLSPATILYVVVNDNDGNNVFRKQFTATEDPSYLSLGLHSYTWNGKDFYGKTVSPNGYKVKVYGKRNTDDIPEKSINVTVINKDLSYLGPITSSWPVSAATMTTPNVIEKTYNTTTKKHRIKVGFELMGSSGDNEIRMGYRDAKGSQFKYWTLKDLPNGKYSIFWDGINMYNEVINTAVNQDYIFWLYGYEKGAYSTSMDPTDINLKITAY